ncbi:MAG: adenylate/guanylate cyclase domain-containing protein [Luteolibacter sp.]
MSTQLTTIEQGDLLRDEALENRLLTSRYQQLDRALEKYQLAAKQAPDDPEIKWRIVATKFLSAGKSEERITIAKDSAHSLLDEVSTDSTPSALQSRAICQQILGDLSAAAECYRDFSKQLDSDPKRLAHARFLARGLLEASNESRNHLDSTFPPLRLVVFAGHLPPRADMECMRLIEKELTALGATVGVASAAAGADLLFLDAFHRQVGTSHIILPWSCDTFRDTSIRPFEEDGKPAVWEPLFENALSSSTSIREIGEMAGTESRIGWQYLMEVSAGIAVQIAKESFLDIVPLALWDGKEGGPGGTAAFCDFWENELKIKPKIIPYDATGQEDETNAGMSLSSHRAQKAILQQSVKSMLFTDVVGFSRLPESAVPAFIEKFLQKISEVIAASKNAPQSVNTWGDAVYAVFDFVQDAGLFALELNEAIEGHAEDWDEAGLGRLRIRTGLHAGPVFLHHDPIVRRLGYSGAHVNRAARIEPVAEEGRIFASEEFAALAAITPACGFTCDDEGSYELAKKYPGKHQLYSVRRDRSANLLPLAKAIHEEYCRKERAKGETPDTNSSMVAWMALPQSLQTANLAQAEDIPNKLRKLGYEIVDTGGVAPSQVILDPTTIEALSATEHNRWMAEKERGGWKYAPVSDKPNLLHNLLIPYDELPDEEKQKDRDTLNNIPILLDKVGYRIAPIQQSTS